MKELSIEEKAKAYDKALKVLHKYDGANIMFTQDLKEEMFPELEESKDEKIRKELIKLLRNLFNNYSYFIKDPFYTECIAWLEKQGEQKPTYHKFRVGDEIKTANEEPLTITKIDEKGYWSEDLFICGFDDAAEWELVEQKPEWSEEDEELRLDAIKYLEIFDAQGIHGDRAIPAINWLKSLRHQKQHKDEQPEYSFIESTYRCGKKPRWNIGDTLAYYEFTSDFEGETELGKITNVELGEDTEDWFYTFEDGCIYDEESLLSNETYKKK